jgi:3-hydroxyacyl-[acyl-carrier-protein] dehydratase
VLVIEAMAQASGILSRFAIGELNEDHEIIYFVNVDNAIVTKPVVPGDQLHLHVSIKRRMRNMVQYICQGKVDGKVVAKAELLCASASK